jgi:hypothetical protein
MASIGDYKETVVLSTDQFREHFANSDDLEIEGPGTYPTKSFQSIFWIIFADIDGSNLDPKGKSLLLPTPFKMNRDLQIQGDSISVAKDQTTGGVGICSPTSDLVISLSPEDQPSGQQSS